MWTVGGSRSRALDVTIWFLGSVLQQTERTISVLLTGLQESEVPVTIDENISTSCKLTATRILYCAVDFTFLNATVTSETCA